jgi:RHS repeat-associated protein
LIAARELVEAFEATQQASVSPPTGGREPESSVTWPVIRPPAGRPSNSPRVRLSPAAAYACSYFGARYLASELGRFTTVDPVYTWKENLVDPQRWNRYTYVRNNPLRFTDPDGRCIYPGADCWQFLIGMGKAAGNIVPDLIDVTNRATELVIAPGSNFGFGNFPRFEPANEDQRRGMISADFGMLLSSAALAIGGETKAAVAIDRWSRQPASFLDQMVLDAAKKGEGTRIIESLTIRSSKALSRRKTAPACSAWHFENGLRTERSTRGSSTVSAAPLLRTRGTECHDAGGFHVLNGVGFENARAGHVLLAGARGYGAAGGRSRRRRPTQPSQETLARKASMVPSRAC